MDGDGQIFHPRIPLFITPNRSMKRFGPAKRQSEAAIEAATRSGKKQTKKKLEVNR